jgi:serine/threonine protein kinase
MKKIGRYEIVEQVGRGAMGIVYKASDPTIGRLVAIKVLSLDPLDIEDKSADPQEIFMREARAAGRLSHPGIVTIHDALEDPETKKNYIVMEFIPGQTLENILIAGPPLTVEKCLDILRQIAEALDYAHKQNIIHRDLKPANILLTEDGRTKITDFGIAKIMAREGAKRTSSIMGTPSYMSPEQLTGGDIDARSDVFSLGILAYLILTGVKPFPGDTAAVMFKIVYEDPVPPSELKPGLGPGHDYLVLRSLVKNRTKRYASAREFLDDLDDVQNGRAPRSEAKSPLSGIRAGERTMAMKGVPRPLVKHPGEGAQGKKKAWEILGGAAAALALVILLGGGYLLFRNREKSSPQATPVAMTSPPVQATTTAPPPVTAPRSSIVTPSVPKPDEGKDKNSKGGTAADSTKPKAQPVKIPAGEAGAQSSIPGGAAKTQKNPAGKDGTAQPPTSPAKTLAATTTPAKSAVARPTTNNSSPATNAGGARAIQLSCKFELKEADLTVSGDGGVIYKGKLEGKKKGGFLHLNIKGGYGGILSSPITIPAGTKNLSVHVLSSGEGVDLTRRTSVAPPSTGTPTLQVSVSEDKITLHWAAPPQK